MYKPTIFAHRGASGKCFENTMYAFKEAYAQGADGIELDVQLTEDGIPIIIHDLSLARVAGTRRNVSTMTYAEIKKVRIGRRYVRILFGHRIPTLHEVVYFCEQNGIALNVELKETVSERPQFISQIIALLSELDDLHVSSFDYHLLERIKEIAPTMETAFLLRKKGIDWDNLDSYLSADGFHLHKRLLIEPYISQLKSTGKKIRVYGVTGNENYIANPPSYINGWITDYPKQLVIKQKGS